MATVKSWTAEEDAILRSMWIDGQGAKAIARAPQLAANGRTHNSVISRAHRLNLPPHDSRLLKSEQERKISATRQRTDKKETAATSQREEAEIDLFPSLEQEIGGEPVRGVIAAINALRADQCRFPIGDTRTADFHYCQKKKMPGGSYCPDCAAKAYQPPSLTRRVNSGIERLVTTKEKTLA